MSNFVIEKVISKEECVDVLKKGLTDHRILNVNYDPKGNPTVFTKAVKFIVVMKPMGSKSKISIKARWVNVALVIALLLMCGFPMMIYSLVQSPMIRQITAEIERVLMKG